MSSRDLSASQATFPSSDSENYDTNTSISPLSEDRPSRQPASPTTRPLILYQPSNIWGILRGAAINVLLPFINGLMLGFGELFAHEAAFRLGWGGTKVFPGHRNSRTIGPGVEMREDFSEARRRDGRELEDLTTME